MDWDLSYMGEAAMRAVFWLKNVGGWLLKRTGPIELRSLYGLVFSL